MAGPVRATRFEGRLSFRRFLVQSILAGYRVGRLLSFMRCIDDLSSSLSRHMKILMMAGEVSGDYQASFLARALWKRRSDIEIFGTGGRHMRAAGVELIHETSHLSSVGLFEPIRHLVPLRGIYRSVGRVLRERRPDLAVLVDNQGFNLAVAKVLRRHRIETIFYFPPQIWVAAPLFARSVARLSRLVISAFPREAEIYRSRYGANAVSYGHPLLDIVVPSLAPQDAIRRAGLDPARPVIGLMPGSRDQEVRELGPAMADAYALIRKANPGVQCVIPVAADHVRPQLEEIAKRVDHDGDVALVDSGAYSCLRACEFVLTCSGTATLELSLLGVPMVVAYPLDLFSQWVARRLAMTDYAAMPNILLGEAAVPEVVRPRITGEQLAERAFGLLRDPNNLKSIRTKLSRVPSHLGGHGAVSRSADRVLEEAAALRR